MQNRLLLNVVAKAMAALMALALTAQARAAAPACPQTPVQHLVLPHMKAALADGLPVVIAALGSSSTWGAMARDIADSYPAELQEDLTVLLPKAEISVINRGINGEDAWREDARMARDVLALEPTMVIWQVGANAAMRGESAGRFGALVERGLLKLQTVPTDIVLMDNQRSRRLLASPDNRPINATLASLAREHRVNLFSRDALMSAWLAADRRPNEFLAVDGVHMNDRGYACAATALANAIAKAVR